MKAGWIARMYRVRNVSVADKKENPYPSSDEGTYVTDIDWVNRNIPVRWWLIMTEEVSFNTSHVIGGAKPLSGDKLCAAPSAPHCAPPSCAKRRRSTPWVKSWFHFMVASRARCAAYWLTLLLASFSLSLFVLCSAEGPVDTRRSKGPRNAGPMSLRTVRSPLMPPFFDARADILYRFF